jgi:Type IV secretion-system coupling protein DNA-binding domain
MPIFVLLLPEPHNVKCLDFIRRQTGPVFSLSDWVKAGRGVLFLPYRADQIGALRSVISVWMRITICETLSLPEGDARIWFIIDELDGQPRLKHGEERIREFLTEKLIASQATASPFISGSPRRP